MNTTVTRTKKLREVSDVYMEKDTLLASPLGLPVGS